MSSFYASADKSPALREVRCRGCGRLLGRLFGFFQIKCPRCGAVNEGQELADKPQG